MLYFNTSGTPASTAHVQAPAIQQELQRLEKISAEISEMIGALEGRLSCIMREPEPSQLRSETKTTEVMSPLVSMLRQHRVETEILAYRLDAILRRLDV